MSRKPGTVLRTVICKAAYKCEGTSHFSRREAATITSAVYLYLCPLCMYRYLNLFWPLHLSIWEILSSGRKTQIVRKVLILHVGHCSRRYGILNPCYNSVERVVLFGINALSLSLPLWVYWRLSLNNPRRRISRSSWRILVLRGWWLLGSVKILRGPKLIQLESCL